MVEGPIFHHGVLVADQSNLQVTAMLHSDRVRPVEYLPVVEKPVELHLPAGQADRENRQPSGLSDTVSTEERTNRDAPEVVLEGGDGLLLPNVGNEVGCREQEPKLPL